MVSTEEEFTNPIEDISPKQRNSFYRKRDEGFYNKESLTSIWQFASVWIFQKETSSKIFEEWNELIFLIDQWIDHILPFLKVFKQTRNVWFFQLIHMIFSPSRIVCTEGRSLALTVTL